MEVQDTVEVDNLTLQKVYYIRGPIPRHFRDSWPNYYIKDPPNAGFSHAFVLHTKGSRVTVFCPCTLRAFTVPRTAGEFCDDGLVPLTTELVARYVEQITSRWAQFRGYGFQLDYDVAARVLNMLGAPVPVFTDPEPVDGDGARRVRGKVMNARLLRPVRRDSRRGEVLAFFLEGPRSLLEAMAVLEMTRSGVLTHLHGLAVEHGVGYELQGDSASVNCPVRDPFGAAERAVRTAASAPAGAETTPVPYGTKRAAVARAASKGWRAISEIAEEAGCTEASVRSHLHDLNAKHGVGFELSPDRRSARVLNPERITYGTQKERGA